MRSTCSHKDCTYPKNSLFIFFTLMIYRYVRWLLSLVFIYFNHFTIISHQSVHFHLHIRSLSINSRRESPGYQVIKHICIFYILISYLFGRIKLYISPVTIRFPNMIFTTQPIPPYSPKTFARWASYRYISGAG